MLNLNFLLIISSCLIGVPFNAQILTNAPKCKTGDEACIKGLLQQIFRNEYPELEVPSLTPFKPTGALDSFAMRTQDTGLGLSVDGHASKMSIYGFDKVEFLEIEGVGKNFSNTNVKITVLVPMFTFCSELFTAKINLLSLPIITADFTANATATSAKATVNFINDVIQKNGKSHLVIKAVNVELNIENVSTHLYSKIHNPIIMGLLNRGINTHWRSVYKEVQSELEDHTGKVIQLVISKVLDQVAIENIFE